MAYVRTCAPSVQEMGARVRSEVVMARREFAPVRPGEIRDSWADVTAAQQVLGYETSVGLHRTSQHSWGLAGGLLALARAEIWLAR